LGDGVKFILHKDKIFLALESHGIKTYMVIIHAFLTSTRVEVSGQLHALAALTARNETLVPLNRNSLGMETWLSSSKPVSLSYPGWHMHYDNDSNERFSILS